MADEPAGTTPATDAPLNEGGLRALEAERTARREAEKKLRQVEEKLATMETERVRADVAAAKGVPAELLTGGSKEELEAHADALLAFKGGDQPASPPGPPSRPQELREGSTPGVADDGQQLADVAARVFSN